MRHNDKSSKAANPGGLFYFEGGNMKKIKDKPIPGKIYCLVGGPDTPCIAAGNSWAESVVIENDKGKKEFHYNGPDKIASIKVIK